MKYLKCIIIFVIISINLSAQRIDHIPTMEEHKNEVDKFQKIDYLNYNYKYLDENHKIEIPHRVFQKLLRENNFYPERINDYADSISVVMCGEFESWTQREIASFRVSYTWKRVGYYLWLTEDEAKDLGNKYSITKPYALIDLIRRHPEDWDDELVSFIANLKSKVENYTGNDDVRNMAHNDFLKFALVENPTRIKDYAELVMSRKNTVSKGCGKPNCCQLEGSTRSSCN
jgi:hypothetical protein